MSKHNQKLSKANWLKEIIELKGVELPKCLPKHARYHNAPKWRSSLMDSEILHNPSLANTHLDSSKGRYFETDFSDQDNGVDCNWPESLLKFNSNFAYLLNTIRTRHDNVAVEIALDIQEYRRKTNQIDNSIQIFLDRFYMSRIGIRMLLGQYIALVSEPPRENYVGVISTRANIYQIIEGAAENAKYICRLAYGLFEAPEIQIICDPSLEMMYVESHLNHAVFEILKNSLRATVEFHGVDSDFFPPIKVIVAKGQEDITIKISDEGGGISRRNIPLVWSYMFTTASPTLTDDPHDIVSANSTTPMAVSETFYY